MGDDPGREKQRRIIHGTDMEQITKNFGTKQVLKGASYTFAKEGIYGLAGAKRRGQDHPVQLSVREYPPDSGKVELVDHSGTRRPLGQGDVGYVLSTPVVPEFLTGYEFVKFFLEITGDPGRTGRTPDDWAGPGGD